MSTLFFSKLLIENLHVFVTGLHHLGLGFTIPMVQGLQPLGLGLTLTGC